MSLLLLQRFVQYRGNLPNLDRLINWAAVYLEKERYLQSRGWLHWLKK
jgi:hypothetical protein